jgi:lipopolysaccharide transport system permease protein
MQIFVQLNLLFHYIEIVRAPLLGRVPAAETWYVVIGTAIVGWAIVFYLYSCFRRRIPYWI